MIHVHLQDGGVKPPSDGLYVAYVNDEHVQRYAKKMLLSYEKAWDRWSYPDADARYRGHIYGWIGPLPALVLG